MKRLIYILIIFVLFTSCGIKESFYKIPTEDLNKLTISTKLDERVVIGDSYYYFNSYSDYVFNTKNEYAYLNMISSGNLKSSDTGFYFGTGANPYTYLISVSEISKLYPVVTIIDGVEQIDQIGNKGESQTWSY